LTHNATASPQIYTLSLHDALPISTISVTPYAPTGIWPRATSSRNSAASENVPPEPPYSSSIVRLHQPRSASLRAISSDWWSRSRSEEHTSELQSRFDLVCRLLPEK